MENQPENMQVRTLVDEANRLYLSDKEYQLMLDNFIPALEDDYVRATDHLRFKRGARLMGESGFRKAGVLDLVYGDSYVPIDERVEIAFLRLHNGKDSTGETEDGKRRDSYIPLSLKNEIEDHAEQRGLTPGDSLFCFSDDQFDDRIKAVANYMADLTGNRDWEDFRGHDLRAYFANRLDEAGVPDEVIMWLGGWEDSNTFRSRYKKSFLPKQVQTYLSVADVLEVDVEIPEEDLPVDYRILKRIEKIENRLANIEQALD